MSSFATQTTTLINDIIAVHHAAMRRSLFHIANLMPWMKGHIPGAKMAYFLADFNRLRKSLLDHLIEQEEQHFNGLLSWAETARPGETVPAPIIVALLSGHEELTRELSRFHLESTTVPIESVAAEARKQIGEEFLAMEQDLAVHVHKERHLAASVVPRPSWRRPQILRNAR